MNILDAIKKRILKFLGIEHLQENPNNGRYDFLYNADDVIKQNIAEYKMWYVGDSDELLNHYTSFNSGTKYSEPLYNRNRANYFWAISSMEDGIKRVHSGVPNAIITTLVNAIGSPKISMKDPLQDRILKKILTDNDIVNIVNQQQMPLTMVEGWGAFKVTFDKELCDVPMLEYYEAQDVDFVYKSNVLLGIIYRDYYKVKDKVYVLFETRRIAHGNSYIEFELFKLDKNNELKSAHFKEVPELKDFDGETIVIEGFNHILGVPSKFFFDPLNKNYGRSLFAGKIDLFDELDQVKSQLGQTVRVSTPIEYIPVDHIKRGKKGQPMNMSTYNRQFIEFDAIPDGEGKVNSQIQTTQPDLNMEQYKNAYQDILDTILTGLLSPATMGIEVAKKDNAEAQREKEKVTIMTRNNIIDREGTILKEVCFLLLSIQEYMSTGAISLIDYDVSVTFNEFANPSFEEKLESLGTAWSSGYISSDMYIDLLWGDKLSDEEKLAELAKIEQRRVEDNLQFGDIMGSDLDNEPSDNYQQEEGVEETTN